MGSPVLSYTTYTTGLVPAMLYTSLLISYFYLKYIFNTLRSRKNESHFRTTFSYAFSCMQMYELRCVSKVRINNIMALVQIIAWRRSGDKPLSEPMMVSLLTHLCVTRPQWIDVKRSPLLRYHDEYNTFEEILNEPLNTFEHILNT